MKYLTALLIAATFALAGCEQDDGPAEEAGEKRGLMESPR